MGMISHMITSNKDNQHKLKTRGMFVQPKSYSDIKKEYAKTYNGTFEYNEATVAEIFNARRELLQNRKTTTIKTWTIILTIVALGTFIAYNALIK
ncbi:MAG: hypothetical protein HKO56_06865 [Bacteroidia bacterium]|nr:hypothetical protein [Bacteroidia bacterium]